MINSDRVFSDMRETRQLGPRGSRQATAAAPVQRISMKLAVLRVNAVGTPYGAALTRGRIADVDIGYREKERRPAAGAPPGRAEGRGIRSQGIPPAMPSGNGAANRGRRSGQAASPFALRITGLVIQVQKPLFRVPGKTTSQFRTTIETCRASREARQGNPVRRRGRLPEVRNAFHRPQVMDRLPGIRVICRLKGLGCPAYGR